MTTNMLAEKITGYFNKYTELKVLFLFDAGQEYRFEFDEAELPDYRKAYYHQNDFYLKVKLNSNWFNDKVVLYLPMQQPLTKAEMQAFPLLDLLLANKGMQPADSIGEFMEKYVLQRNQRTLAEKYIAELKYRNTQEVLKPWLTAENFTEDNIIQGLVSGFVKYTQAENWELIIMRLLTLTASAQDGEGSKLYRKIKDTGTEDYVLNKIHKHTGILTQNLSPVTTREIFDRIKYNLIVQSIGPLHKDDPYKSYVCKSSTATASINLLHEKVVSNSRYHQEWISLLNSKHSDVHESKIVALYGPQANYHLLTSKLKWAIISELVHQPEADATDMLTGISKLMSGPQEPLIENILQFMFHTYSSIAAIKQIKTYILDKADQYIHQYTTQYYKIDQHYRKAIWHYRFKTDFADVPVDINWDAQVDVLNDHYRQFLEKLNREWLKCWSAEEFDMNALHVMPQYQFYKKEIESTDQKIAVIISDALRYEAGMELMNTLNADPKNIAKCHYMVASIPSKTSVGMANLLPGKNYNFSNAGIVVDGITTDTIERRSAVLQATNKDSRAVKYTEVVAGSQMEKRELFKNKVVYIYHDVIDATGDKVASERRTFNAVEEAIQDLNRFIKLLHGSYNVSKVLVTADHGFLYNDFTIAEKDKEKGSGAEPLIAHSRFEILSTQVVPALGYIFPLKNTTQFSEDLYVVIPGSVNRYSRSGAGNQYVHGGASLQELMVPVIESTRKREDVTGLVNPQLVSKDLKVVSNVLRINLIQEAPVSAALKERTIVVGLYSSSGLVSNEKELELNKVSENATGRLFQFDLHLIQGGKMDSYYKLKVFDKGDKINPLIEADVKNQTLIQTDF